MKFSISADFQVLEEIADIMLSVEFPREDIEKYNLKSPTIFVTYDLEGNFQSTSVCDEGLTVDLLLTDVELEQLFLHIDEQGLKMELLKKINQELNLK